MTEVMCLINIRLNTMAETGPDIICIPIRAINMVFDSGLY